MALTEAQREKLRAPRKVRMLCLYDGRTQTRIDDGITVDESARSRGPTNNVGRNSILRALAIRDKQGNKRWALIDKLEPRAAGDRVGVHLMADSAEAKAIRKKLEAKRAGISAAANQQAEGILAQKQVEATAQGELIAKAVVNALAIAGGASAQPAPAADPEALLEPPPAEEKPKGKGKSK